MTSETDNAVMHKFREGLMKYIMPLIFLLSAALLSSCGHSGASGNAYAAVDYSAGDSLALFNFQDFPSSFYVGDYYQMSAGTYELDYTIIDTYGYYWPSTNQYYSYDVDISVNPGQPGGLFYNGADGADIYYKCWLGLSGLSIETGGSAFDIEKTPVKSQVIGGNGSNSQTITNGRYILSIRYLGIADNLDMSKCNKVISK
jgi:hypothetical protein